jgi:alginate O-acetyltransferase complex protein AlgI
MPANPEPHAPTYRFALAWVLLVGGIGTWWCCRPWLPPTVFAYGQVVVLMLSWKVASLLCLPAGEWSRFTPLRFLAYCLFPGMQPRQFLREQRLAPGAPVPTVTAVLVNAASGAALVWVAPRLLPAATPLSVRFWVALVGFSLLMLFARLDLYALIFRALGFPVEKFWDCPIAAATLGDFWGRRWNRLVSGLLRDVLFFPLARRVGARLALFAVFLYSGFYHEAVSFLTDSGYGGPMMYFLIQYAGVAAENLRPVRCRLQAHPWLSRAWTAAVVVVPVGLFVQPRLIEEYLLPLLVEARVPGLLP